MKQILNKWLWNYMVSCGFILFGGGKSDAPNAPDYTAAAQATAQGNADAARIAAKANRVSQYTPYGNLIYTQGNGAPTFNQTAYDNAYKNFQTQQQQYNQQQSTSNPLGKTNGIYGNKGIAPTAPNINDFYTKGDQDTWTATQTLSPAEQAKLDKNNNLSLGLLDTAQLGLGGVNSALSKGFDFNALPAQQVNAGQTAQDAIEARLNPQFAQSEDALRTRLANQGVTAGSQAWDNEFRNFNQGKNDAYSQAALQGISVGQQARQQALQEQEFGRTEGLNMVNALRTGNQVQQPNFVNTPQQATTAGADLLGATNAQYQAQSGNVNAQNAQSANTTNGLISLAGTAGTFFL
jgi:hypothetical protein